MIAALLGLVTGGWSKLATYAVAIAGAVAAVLGFAVMERRAGAAGVRAADVARELDDRRTADAISADVAAMGDAAVVEELKAKWSRP